MILQFKVQCSILTVQQTIIFITIRVMVNISCSSDGSCPYQYFCHINQCIHDPVFPITGYPIAIYCLFPFASALCNTSGNSFGSFKVLLLMDALDYTESQATIYCYPLILGTALFNYFALILRRHPTKDTSSIDYNIVLIIIPNILYGSTIGTLINDFIPPIIADVLITLILIAFSVNFFMKFRKYRKKAMQKQQQSKIVINQNNLTQQQSNAPQQKQFSNLFDVLTSEQIKTIVFKDQNSKLQVQGTNSNINSQNKAQNDKNKQSATNQIIIITNKNSQNKCIQQNPFQDQLDKQLQYQSTYHLPHIIATIIIFAIFQTISFLAQGKIIKFSVCTVQYLIGIICLTFFYILVQIGMYFFTKKKMLYYRKISYDYEYQLQSPKFFLLVSLGAFLGGLNSGLLAIGNSTTIIFTLLYLKVEPIIATSTVGYQVVFSAAASLLQAIAKQKIPLNVAGFFIGLTFFGGGILSYIVASIVKKLNVQKVNTILMAIIGSLTGSSAISMIVNIILGFINFGTPFMVAPGQTC